MSQVGTNYSIPYDGHRGDDPTSGNAIMSQGVDNFNIPYESEPTYGNLTDENNYQIPHPMTSQNRSSEPTYGNLTDENNYQIPHPVDKSNPIYESPAEVRANKRLNKPRK